MSTLSWTFKMAWRDSRGSRRHLLLFLASMALGVAALVAINSFGENLELAVDEQAKELLGADLSFETRQPFTPAAEALIDSLGGDQSRSVSFASMVLFPESDQTRLATVRAMQGAYPYYGSIVSSPAEAARSYLSGRNALVDASLMQQFGVEVGDSVQIGSVRYRVAGALEKVPRENQAIALFSPRVYIPLEELDESLLTAGSRAEYEIYFRFEDDRDVEAIVASIEARLETLQLGYDTVDEAKENWDEALTNLYRFLGLIAFVALLLGGIGIASAVHVYIKQRIGTIAVLRCLGAAVGRTFTVYLMQAAALGVVGGIAGAAAGVLVQLVIPRILSDFLPVQVPFFVAWEAVLVGIGAAVGVTASFALLPLLSVRRISPLRTLRAGVDDEERPADHSRWAVMLVVAAGVAGFAVLQAPTWEIGLGYFGGLVVVFGLLALVARLITAATRRYFPSSWSYVWRQGLANLHRPNNQTGVLMVSLGLGSFLILTLFLVEGTLLDQIRVAGGEGRPNVVLFDVQPDQLEGVTEVVRSHGLPVVEEVPIVTMRLQEVAGRSLDSMRADTTIDLSWAMEREYRSTYRGSLTESESILEGTFYAEMPEGATAAPVSVEQEVAQELGVVLGDTLVWNVQGLPVTTVVASIREVDWRRFSTNFFVVFPEGALEEAPQFLVLLTRADREASAALQAAVVREFPNVSAIDLSLVLNTFDAIFDRIAFVIRFMALFSVLTGLLVLVGAVVVSRFQRVQESVLLKTLGASRRQIIQIMAVEYFFLGLLAACTGLVLALGAGWGLARFLFETDFVPDPLPVSLTVAAVALLTVAVGMWISRDVYNRTPLEVLRAEG